MAVIIYIVALLCVASAAPPLQLYQHSLQLQQHNPLDYYLDSPRAAYYQPEHKSESLKESQDESPARLETLDPNTEVELIPGGQAPQQPPQQIPFVPNTPGLIPGQKVFIIHMPVPGNRPGTIGGYQPVFVVAAAPQGNTAYLGNQNPFLLNPSGQPVSPMFGYPTPGFQGNVLYGAAGYNRAVGFGYPQPQPNYQQIPAQQTDNVPPNTFSLKQLVSLQQVVPAQKTASSNDESENLEPKSASLKEDAKEVADDKIRSIKLPEGMIRN